MIPSALRAIARSEAKVESAENGAMLMLIIGDSAGRFMFIDVMSDDSCAEAFRLSGPMPSPAIPNAAEAAAESEALTDAESDRFIASAALRLALAAADKLAEPDIPGRPSMKLASEPSPGSAGKPNGGRLISALSGVSCITHKQGIGMSRR